MSTFEQVQALFLSGGSEEYLGEDVKLVEHMLQCADLARQQSAPPELVVAALLHDIGHLLVEDAAAAHEASVDAHHDDIGARWVAKLFPPSVSDPVKLHVEAKRYLVSTDPAYASRLSEASRKTLAMQGGALNQEEIDTFLALPGARDSILLRLWDDAAKIRGKQTPPLESYRSDIEKLAATKVGR